MTPKSLFITLALSALCTVAAHSADIDSLATVIATANPDIGMQRVSRLSEAQDIQSENALSDLEAEMEHVWGMKHIGNKFSIGLSQEFQLPMAYHSRSKLAQAIRHESDAETRVLQSDVRLQAKKLLIALAFNRSIARLRDSVAAVADRRVTTMQGMLRRGVITRLDLYKARMEAVECRRNRESALRQIADIENSLSLLGGGANISAVDITVPRASQPPLPWSVYEESYNQHNPMPVLVAAAREAAQRRQGVIRAERWPALSVGYAYQAEMGDKFHGFNLSMTLPVYSRKSKTKAAELAAAQVLMSDSVADSRTFTEMKQAYTDAQSLWSEISLMQEVMGGDSDFMLIDRMKQAGTISSSDYMSELIAMLSARVALLETERDYLQSIATLSRFFP